MKRLVQIIIGLVILAIIVILAIMFVPIKRTGPTEALSPDFKPEQGRGEYLARMADCAACHTAPGGQPYAGGREVKSPFGIIYSSNITPDENGIKNMTLDQFRDALRDGIGKNGELLYPAMPYENYRKISEPDIVALYDYFMNGVKPVSAKVKETNLSFPFNQRWGIRLWNFFAISGKGGFEPRFNDAKLDRGAYLVESLGHCGACHTPRDSMFRQSGTNSDSNKFLTGETIDGFYGPNLRSPNSSVANWTADDLKAYLQTGRNSHSAVVGPMTLVVEESMQFATEDDLDSIVAYLKHIALPGDASKQVRDPKKTTDMLTEAKPDMALGARLYMDNCNACHFVNGKGAKGVFPELDGAKIVNAKDASGLLRVIVNGSRMPSTEKRPADLAMPGFGWRMNDDEVAALATFLRSSWTNDAPAVTAADVAKVRTK
ncbi:Cytochrome c-like domain [Bartonella choladocola]|uniref:c-type cytochrome n=1 Tax=Bartonella TaxID=773 RepID=UPI0018DD73DB|nr:cytochrome c [Bartonella choladocola]MBI0139457.1 cytochrome c [Bartonella choladocola]